MEKKQVNVHFPMTIQYLKKLDVGTLQEGITFKGLKIDRVVWNDSGDRHRTYHGHRKEKTEFQHHPR